MHGRICPSTISCTLLLIRTKTSQKSQENAGFDETLGGLRANACKIKNQLYLKSQEPIIMVKYNI
jgi:hypothetical protein